MTDAPKMAPRSAASDQERVRFLASEPGLVLSAEQYATPIVIELDLWDVFQIGVTLEQVVERDDLTPEGVAVVDDLRLRFKALAFSYFNALSRPPVEPTEETP